jgi:glucosamine--fructose-6-phosphate aminotransferase (isomerizing)
MTTLMRDEITEQPRILADLVDRFAADVASVRALITTPPDAVVLVGRGSSDNAATLGRYAIEYASGRPVALASPSLITRYRARLDYRNVLVVGLSQSGRTPEITETVAVLRASGARAIAVTNDVDSPLAASAELTLGLGAGTERAVPATKTVTAQMLRMLVIAAALGDGFLTSRDLDGLPEAVATVAADAEPAAVLARRWTAARTMLVVARGASLAAAEETALKIREAAGITAIATSSADLVHGPIAAVEHGDAVLLVDSDPATSDDMNELARRLAELGAGTARLGTGAADALTIPGGLNQFLVPILATVRGQQLALELALARGRNPDAPAGLTKVTVTR